MPTFADLMHKTLHDVHYEPVKSTRDRSVREMVLGPHHIRHRFPVPGGITGAQILARQMTANNPLLERLRQRP